MAKNFQQQPLDENELIKIRREKLKGFTDKGVEPFGARYEVSHHAADVRAEFGEIEGEVDAGEVSIAGRLMAIRGHGKASFATLAVANLDVFKPMKLFGQRAERLRQNFKILNANGQLAALCLENLPAQPDYVADV